jgi:hypothetical protein
VSASAKAAAAYRAGERDVAALAARFGVSTRTIDRWLVDLGARAKRARPDFTRADALLDEGVPASWVAAETGVSYDTLVEHARKRNAEARRQAALDWARAWGSIKASPALLELHREIAPPTYRQQKVNRAA